jgi:hypothetical protein
MMIGYYNMKILKEKFEAIWLIITGQIVMESNSPRDNGYVRYISIFHKY